MKEKYITIEGKTYSVIKKDSILHYCYHYEEKKLEVTLISSNVIYFNMSRKDFEAFDNIIKECKNNE